MIHIDPNEKIILEVRRHWYVVLAELLLLIFFLLLPFIILAALNLLTVFSANVKLLLLFAFLTSVWFLSVWVWFFTAWTNYYLDVWLITTKRIIDVEQFTLFRREVSDFRLDRIQDVTVEVKGVFAHIFRFGDLYVQTAGQARQFVLRHAPHPYKVKDVIVKEHDRVLAEGQG